MLLGNQITQISSEIKCGQFFLHVKIIFSTVKGTKSAISTAEGQKRNFLLITENCIELNCFTSVVPLQVNLLLIQNKIISGSLL